MQVYRWQARRRDGKLVRGTLRAHNPQEVALHIQGRYGYVTSIKESWRLEQVWLGKRQRKLNLQEKEFFFRQLGVLLVSGVNILRALDLLAVQASATLGRVSKALQRDLENGLSFSFSLRKRPQDFSDLVAQLVAAGEASGNLAFLFKQLAEYYRGVRQVRKTIATACLYPTIVLLCVILTVSYFLLKVLPVIFELYGSLALETNAFILFVGSLVQGSREYFYPVLLLLLLTGSVVYCCRNFLLTRCWQLPVLCNLYHAFWEARYCRILALLLASGIPLVQSLQIITPLLPTYGLRNVSLAISTAVIRGVPLSKAGILHGGVFSQLSIEFISLGEEHGGLSDMLGEAADVLEEELELKLKHLKILLEPLFLLLLTAFIGGTFYFLLKPIYGLITGLPNYQ